MVKKGDVGFLSLGFLLISGWVEGRFAWVEVALLGFSLLARGLFWVVVATLDAKC